MNRKDREVLGLDVIDILNRCDTLRIGFMNGKQVYVVPVSFGVEIKDDLVIYFHCAKTGLKIDCLQANPQVGFEADIFYKTEPVGKSITARYESIIGNGIISEASSDEEKVHGLDMIVKHYHYNDFPVKECKSLPRTTVYKIAVKEITGKRNLPQNNK